MEAQLHHTHAHHHDDPLLPAVIEGTEVHDEDEHNGEKKSVIKKVKEKAKKLKETIKHGHGHGGDDEETVYESPAVRSGLVEPTGDLGTPVLVEDLHATHSDIVDPPVRSFAQWEEEERRGAPPPLSAGIYGTGESPVRRSGYGEDVNMEQPKGNIGKSTGMEEEKRHGGAPPSLSAGVYGTGESHVRRRGFGEDVNMEQPRGTIGKSTGMAEDPSAPNLTTAGSPVNYQTKVTDPTNSGVKEAVGITEVLRSFDKMGVYNEHEPKSSKSDEHEQKLYSGSHDQFAPEPVESPPPDTVARNPSGYTGKISAATSAIVDKATGAKDVIESKLGYSGDNRTEPGTGSPAPTGYVHKVAETVTGTLAPVYEKVVGAGSSVMSKMHGSGQDDKEPESEVPVSKGAAMKEYLVETFRPGDDDKELSEVSHAFHRPGKGGEPEKTTVAETEYVTDEMGNVAVERRLQESGN